MVHKKTTKKRGTKKKTTKKKVAKKTTPKIPHVNVPENKMEKILIENFVSLQKVMTNLSVKFDNLTNHISKLLDLFEISAKALAEKDVSLEKTKKDDSELIQKMDSLLDQNKTIARGLTLMHDRISEPAPMQRMPMREPPQGMEPPKTMPERPRFPKLKSPVRPMSKTPEGEYHKSISSGEKFSQ